MSRVVQTDCLGLFKSQLDKRTQVLVINYVKSVEINKSATGHLKKCVGSLKFFITINNIAKVNFQGELFLFAAVTAVVSSGCTMYMGRGVQLDLS